MVVRQTFGTARRPVEQGILERCHQELQKVLGTLVVDVARSFPDEWAVLLPVVEFMLYTTPGEHSFSPTALVDGLALGEGVSAVSDEGI